MDQISRWLSEAERTLLRGQLPNTETLCNRILAQQPKHEEALMLLGTVYLQQAKLDAAIACYDRVAANAPGTASAYLALGMSHQARGEFETAVLSFRLALELEPDTEEATILLANCLNRMGRKEEAQEVRRTAAKARHPAEISASAAKDRTAPIVLQGTPAFSTSLSYRPRPTRPANKAEAEYARGVDALLAADLQSAEARFRKAIALRPNYPDAINNLGTVLHFQNRFEESERSFRRVLELRKDSADAYENLAGALVSLDRYDEAYTNYKKAIALAPDEASPHYNVGVLLHFANRHQEALESFQRALTLDPAHALARYNRGMTQLLLGQFEEGWNNHEARLDSITRPLPTELRWDGSPLEGRTILIHAEQGLGDTIQFARLVKPIKAQGARVAFTFHHGLGRLFAGLEGVDELLEPAPNGQIALPPFDTHIELMSLPLLLGIRLDTVPASVPYLRADDDNVRDWKRFFKDFKGLKVGIVWAGNPKFQNDLRRSVSLQRFAPLAAIPGVSLFSLQKGAVAAQALQPPEGMPLIDLAPRLNDFADTAAALECLDLVITVDTSVAHLAGALGRPVWNLLPFSPDWRWLKDREDSPWYPTMRLFRQPAPNNWDPVFDRVVTELLPLRS